MSLINWQTQLRKGLIDLAVLRILDDSKSHGYEMTETLRKTDGLKIYEGNIYPILGRLKAEGLIASYYEPSKEGPPRKCFQLTESGRKTLADMNKHWEHVVKDIQNLSKGPYR